VEPFVTVTAVAAPLPRANIDTDAIIPVVWLRSSTKDMSKGLFELWRRDASGRENPDFVLNKPRFRNAAILVAGANFGCGSSREAAVWALTYSGIRCVIAPSFGDIFYENAFKNGLLAAIVSEPEAQVLLEDLERAPDPTLTVDLGNRRILRDGDSHLPFSIAENRRVAMMEGRDEIGTSLSFEARLREFQTRDRQCRPWVYDYVDES
jgi:3-isopropylmalate/(R)-2-methylmalate dehydratase small subunit